MPNMPSINGNTHCPCCDEELTVTGIEGEATTRLFWWLDDFGDFQTDEQNTEEPEILCSECGACLGTYDESEVVIFLQTLQNIKENTRNADRNGNRENSN